MGVVERVKKGWNAFLNKDPTNDYNYGAFGMASTTRPDRFHFRYMSNKSIISAIYTRIAMDVASIEISHVRLDQNGRYLEQTNSGLNSCLHLEANIDQTSVAFKQDLVMTLFEEGVIAVVPVDTKYNPLKTDAYDILTLRVGVIKQWYPRHIRVNLYNDRTGKHEELTLPKEMVAIIENPLYSVMNDTNSTLIRLRDKLALLDVSDSRANSGKLDLIIQLPYTVRTESRQKQAEARRKNIEAQLIDSPYGIAYTDGTERITQLNRPAENNLLMQVNNLKAELYSQLGLSEDVFKGLADEAAMINYYTRTIEPIVNAITEEFKRKFLTKTARTQGQSVEYYRNPFGLVPVSSIAEIADKFTRNEILSSNEVRQIIGYKPVPDSKADELRNKNIPQSDLSNIVVTDKNPETVSYDEGSNV